jgi:hypothetical protein
MDAGAKARLDTLRRDVERKMMEPLRLHGWTVSIEREFADGPLNDRYDNVAVG